MVNKDKELLDLLKSYGFSDEDLKEGIMKGNIKVGEAAPESSKEPKGGEEEESEEEVEKAKKAKEDLFKKEQEKGIEKSIQDSELMKSMETKFDSLEEKIEEVSILKSQVEELSELIKGMSANIEKIGNTPNIQKSVGSVNFLEKGAIKKDEGDRIILSVSAQKEDVQDLLSKSIDAESDEVFKSMLQDDLINLNAGGCDPSKDTSMYLFNKKGVRLVK